MKVMEMTTLLRDHKRNYVHRFIVTQATYFDFFFNYLETNTLINTSILGSIQSTSILISIFNTYIPGFDTKYRKTWFDTLIH